MKFKVRFMAKTIGALGRRQEFIEIIDTSRKGLIYHQLGTNYEHISILSITPTDTPDTIGSAYDEFIIALEEFRQIRRSVKTFSDKAGKALLTHHEDKLRNACGKYLAMATDPNEFNEV